MASWLLLTLALLATDDPRDRAEDVSHSFDEAVASIDEGWVTFRFTLRNEQSGPCCWTGHGYGTPGRHGCDLDERRHGFSGTSDVLPTSRSADVLIAVEDGSPTRAVVVGETCPLTGGAGTVLRIDTTESLAILERLASDSGGRGADRMAAPARFALALHEDERATEVLESMAREHGTARAEQAAFWLGAERGEAGLEALDRLLDGATTASARRRIVTALAQSESPGAVPRLAALARDGTDAETRADAVFWLAQEAPEAAIPIIRNRLATQTEGRRAERLLHALTMLPDEQGTQELLAVVHGPYPRSVRKQALFWLAQSDDPAAIDAVVALLDEDDG